MQGFLVNLRWEKLFRIFTFLSWLCTVKSLLASVATLSSLEMAFPTRRLATAIATRVNAILSLALTSLRSLANFLSLPLLQFTQFHFHWGSHS